MSSSTSPLTLPATFQKLSCHTLSADFRSATAIVSVPLVTPSKNNVLISVQHVGINASDVNVCCNHNEIHALANIDTPIELLFCFRG